MKTNVQNIHLGLNDLGTEGQFKWTDGSPMVLSHW